MWNMLASLLWPIVDFLLKAETAADMEASLRRKVDEHKARSKGQAKPPSFEFSIAFLLWLTAACAFVLGIAVWTPCLLNPVLAAGLVAIVASAYRKGRPVFWRSLVLGVTTTAIAYGDWLVHVAKHSPEWTEPAISVFEALLFAIIGLGGGLALSSLPSNRRMLRRARKRNDSQCRRCKTNAPNSNRVTRAEHATRLKHSLPRPLACDRFHVDTSNAQRGHLRS